MKKGRKILVSYGNEKYYRSMKRLETMALSTKQFDEVVLFSDKDLPDYIKQSELMLYSRGGGYWVWKPWCVIKVLEKCNDNDIIVYSDAGNELFEHKEWQKFWKIMDKNNAIFFKYGALMKKWCLKAPIEYYKKHYLFNHSLQNLFQIQSGFFITNKKALPIFHEQLRIMLEHPEFVIDASEDEIKNQFEGFVEHRHDQAILSCIVYPLIKEYKLCVRWQHSEFLDRNGQAVFNARISDNNRRSEIGHFEPYWKKYLKKLILTPVRDIYSFINFHF